MSIVSLLFMTVLPFLFSALAVLISPFMLYPVCFGKAFAFAFAAVGISQAFGNGGWLVRLLALFSSCLLLPLLYFLWLRLLHGRLSRCGLALILALAVLVCSVDHRIIAPVLASLINN